MTNLLEAVVDSLDGLHCQAKRVVSPKELDQRVQFVFSPSSLVHDGQLLPVVHRGPRGAPLQLEVCLDIVLEECDPRSCKGFVFHHTG